MSLDATKGRLRVYPELSPKDRKTVKDFMKAFEKAKKDIESSNRRVQKMIDSRERKILALKEEIKFLKSAIK